ncbi:DNA methyltransferase [Limosilactobacillus fermentum]|uniref:DNA methyltransferase n=1 Tax=Limosilactobacillus fermentum TaxID=1613 RepID=UPI002F268D77
MATRQQNAREFVKTWSSSNKGREDADRQTFWNDLLQRVYGINDYYNYITYEKDVQVKADGKVTTRRIDGYIPSTKVMIEMKGKKVSDLSKPLIQSGGDELTPFEQAKRYANFLPANEYPRWIVVSNFNQIDIHDMNNPLAEPTTIKLNELPDKFKALEFMVDANQQQVIDEKQLSVDAGNLVAKIYDELTKAYAAGRGVDVNDPKIQQSLNMLIVRIVFLMYADDSGLFGTENLFQKFIADSRPEDIRQRLHVLFKTLDQKEEDRDPYLSNEYDQFAYVNGGMFSDENIIIPQFTTELKRLIVEDAGAGFDWSGISPTIFGAVFESTLNPETRRSGGMHYTSIENIHKVIDPLFLNDLHDEFDKIQNMGNRRQRIDRARDFRAKLGRLKFLDPACGSGNFLTETYLSLRKMENECLRIIVGDQGALAVTDESEPQVKIQNFYGIEINDFAVSVARTAMWIAESQMWEQTKDITFANKDFLPLDSNDSIYEGNALRMDWTDIVKPYELNYIMGNPPFVGARLMSEFQKADVKAIFKKAKGVGNLDYVAAWYALAANYINGTSVHCALVSTNSITEGQQPAILWTKLKKYNISINFAYQTFAWDNEAKDKAHVHVVIVGFSQNKTKSNQLYLTDGRIRNVGAINPYLSEGPMILITSRTKPIANVDKMVFGSMPNDGGFLSKIAPESRENIVSQYPNSKGLIRRFIGSRELLHNEKRYTFWLKDVTPGKWRNIKPIYNAVTNVRNYRENSKREITKKLAKTPALFGEIRQPSSTYLAVPRHSSKNRMYVPMELMQSTIIAGDSLLIVPNASLELFSIMESSVQTAWIKVIAGRIKSDYRYSANVVYNNFPWPTVSDKQKDKLARTAKGILNARKLYPDSSLADLYDPLTMPAELRKAHEANDKAVLKAYGLKQSASESEIVQHLFKMYEELTRSTNGIMNKK